MLIVGDQYKFHPSEIEILEKTYNIIYIKDTNKDLEKKILNILKKEKCGLIVLNTRKSTPKLTQFLTSLELQGVKFLTIEHFLEKYLKKLYIPRDGTSLKFLDEIKPFSKRKYILKRIIDFSISIPLIIFTSPIMIYSIFKIKQESPDGPILFKQKRIGKNGKTFECIKFRSMRTNIDFFDHYTQEDDPRIFPWGKFMRKMRIDELPQLWNVLKGDMHLLGPRAEWDELVKQYEQKWSFYHTRHLIAPGITGWAQINYPYGKDIEDTYHKLMYDLYYIKNWSLLLEVKTIFLTILVILKRKGL
jgi:lipopolysaccharide/colanic/teichoic acid biosynthesis glycosyltransferase